MSKTADNFLLNYILHLGNKNSFQNMNISQRYVRLFPILGGATRFTTITNAPVLGISMNYSTKSELDSLKKLESNPYFSKYVNKIKKLEKTDPVEFRKRLREIDEMHKKKTEEICKKESGPSCTNKEANKPNTTHIQSNDLNQASKGLDSILILELIEDLPKTEIEKLWLAHYADKDAVCATISSQTYNNICKIAKQYPVFVYPIPRKDGYEIFVGQFCDNSFHFTSLLNYQKHKENSPSQLSLKHYVEMQEKKDLVLMSGMVMDEGISVTDAQLLSYFVQHFHIEHSDLILKFHESPEKFDVSLVISAINNNLLTMASATAK